MPHTYRNVFHQRHSRIAAITPSKWAVTPQVLWSGLSGAPLVTMTSFTKSPRETIATAAALPLRSKWNSTIFTTVLMINFVQMSWPLFFMHSIVIITRITAIMRYNIHAPTVFAPFYLSAPTWPQISRGGPFDPRAVVILVTGIATAHLFSRRTLAI